MADIVFNFGQHRGKTFADVKDNHPDYVSYALGQPDPAGGLKEFVAYLRAEGLGDSSSTLDEPKNVSAGGQRLLPGDTVVTFGQHRGRTYRDLKDNEPGYVSYALKQETRGGDLEDFVNYLRAEGIENVPTPSG